MPHIGICILLGFAVIAFIRFGVTIVVKRMNAPQCGRVSFSHPLVIIRRVAPFLLLLAGTILALFL